MATQRDAPLDFGAITFESLDVAAIAHDLLGSEELARNGRSARTLAKGKGMTAVLTAVRAGWRDSRTRGAWPRRHRAGHRGGHCRGTREPSISHAGLGPDAIHRTRQKGTGFRLRKMPRSSCLSDSSLEETVERRRGLCSAKSRSGVDCAG